jgi:hypothetical protein
MTVPDLASAILRLKLGITAGTEPVTTVHILDRADIQTVLDGLYEASRRADKAEERIKAAPHQFPQCFRFLCNEDDLTYPCTCWKQMP